MNLAVTIPFWIIMFIYGIYRSKIKERGARTSFEAFILSSASVWILFVIAFVFVIMAW